MPSRKVDVHLSAKLGASVRFKRLQLGLTQEVFVERCGFYRTYLSRIETGTANPTLNALEIMALVLNTRPSELLACAEGWVMTEDAASLGR
jgi:transcriptional regulator with XRE-family HTH domain